MLLSQQKRRQHIGGVPAVSTANTLNADHAFQGQRSARVISPSYEVGTATERTGLQVEVIATD